MPRLTLDYTSGLGAAHLPSVDDAKHWASALGADVAVEQTTDAEHSPSGWPQLTFTGTEEALRKLAVDYAGDTSEAAEIAARIELSPVEHLLAAALALAPAMTPEKAFRVRSALEQMATGFEDIGEPARVEALCGAILDGIRYGNWPGL